MKTKQIISIIAIIAVIVFIGILGYGYYQKFGKEAKNPVVTMEVEGFGTVKIELYPEKAPNTVANFIALANRGFYNGLTFHRTIPNFMIQGGDKEGTGAGNTYLSDLKEGGEEKAYTIKGEFSANGYQENDLRFEEGIIAMARSDYGSLSSSLLTEGYNSASSQFFITTTNYPSLNGLYTAFGKVIEGMEVVHAIENVEVVTRDSTASEGVDKPVNPPKITKISVETYGVDYGLPETLEPFDVQSWFMQQMGGSY